MDRKKKARLHSAGWAVASARDFLELSEAESALIELKLNLSRLHRERREQAGFSQQALAKRLHSSQSRVAKMEAGDPSVSMDLMVRSLLVLGTPAAILAARFGDLITESELWLHGRERSHSRDRAVRFARKTPPRKSGVQKLSGHVGAGRRAG